MIFAGMPNPIVLTLTEGGRLRIQAISFFLFGFLLSAGLIQLLWNYLRRDFSRLPRLTYFKSLGLVTLWGLVFVLVLTMISGARELMTPGAWEPQGATYRLKKKNEETEEPVASGPTERERENKLQRLRAALWTYARQHTGKFPPDQTVSEIAPECWQTADLSKVPYVYVPGQQADQGTAPLAYEPEMGEAPRLVLLTNGAIRLMSSAEIAQAQAQAGVRRKP
jgi:hypothetical protein